MKNLKKHTEVDNSELEALLEEDITPEMQFRLFEILKKSQLYLPVTPSPNMFEGIENAKVGDTFQPKGQAGFDINYLTDNEGNKAVPLFTSSEMMEKAGVASSVMVMFTSDLADMLKQSDRYQAVAINPFTEHDINMPFEAFISMFDEPTPRAKEYFETMEAILKILKEKSIVLEEDYAFYVRDNEPFMKNLAVDGVFVPDIPFNASTRKDFHGEMKYLNILLMPKTSRIVYTGDFVDENAYDVIIAPGSEFEEVENIDEFTTVWKCRAQPFYD